MLTERGINIGIGLRNKSYFERACPILRQLADRLDLTQRQLETLRAGQRQGKKGPYWIIALGDNLKKAAPKMYSWASTTEQAAHVQGWETANKSLNLIKQMAVDLLRELLDGMPPSSIDDETDPPSVVTDAETIMRVNWGIIPPGFAQNKNHKNERQKTRIISKRKRKPRKTGKAAKGKLAEGFWGE